MALVVLVLIGVLAWMVYAAGRRQAARELDQTALAKSEMHRLEQLEEMSRRVHRLNEATVRIACQGAVTPERLANQGDVECLFAAYEAVEGSGWDDLGDARNVAVSEIFNRRAAVSDYQFHRPTRSTSFALILHSSRSNIALGPERGRRRPLYTYPMSTLTTQLRT